MAGSNLGAVVLSEPIVYLGMAGLLVPLAKRLGLDEILTFLIIGILIGPDILGQIPELHPFLLTNDEDIALLGDLGVIFLMFTIGLELSPSRLFTMRRLIAGVGGLQIIATILILAVAMMALQFPPEQALLFGICMSLSSTAMVMHRLGETKRMGEPLGRASFGILLAQDLAVIPLLFVVVSLGNTEAGALDINSLGFGVLQAILIMLAMYGIGRVVVRPILVHSRFTGRAGFMAIILLVMFVMSAGAELAGLSSSLGALLAGLVFASTSSRYQIEADIEPFKSLLLGLFFLSTGMLLPLDGILWQLPQIIGLIILVLLIKSIVIMALMTLFRQTRSASIEAALLLAPAGEFAFILLATATQTNLIDDATKQILVSVVLISMMTHPFLASWGAKLAKRTEAKENALHVTTPAQDEEDIADVLLLGIGRVGTTIAEALSAQAITYIAVDNHMNHVREARRAGIDVLFGEAKREDFLAKLHVDKRQVVVVALDDPYAVFTVTKLIRQMAPHATIISRAHDEHEAQKLRDQGADTAIPDMLGSSLLMSEETLRSIGLTQEMVSETRTLIQSRRSEQLDLNASFWQQ